MNKEEYKKIIMNDVCNFYDRGKFDLAKKICDEGIRKLKMNKKTKDEELIKWTEGIKENIEKGKFICFSRSY